MKRILFLVAVLMGILLICRAIFADAVYLKNGRVMRGKIVEKNEQFLVLRIGEGENSVRATIFLDDINRIESEEEYSQKTKLIPAELYKKEFEKPLVIQPSMTFFDKSQLKTDEAERIKALLEENKRLATSGGSQITSPAHYQLNEGDGSISGFVKLPDLLKRKKGDLYVYLMQDVGAGKFSTASHMLYQKIDKNHINSTLMYYKIEHVSVGVYKVFAQWDTAVPFIEERNTELYKTLIGLGLKGDYWGSSQEEVRLAADENRQNVNFNCLEYLSTDRVVSVKGQRPDFQIVDLYYRKLSLQKVLFILVIKNMGQTTIPSLGLDLLINDEKVFSGPIELGPLRPREEKEFDITPTYEAYNNKLKQENKVPKEGIKMLKFKILWPATGEVEFEKVLFML